MSQVKTQWRNDTPAKLVGAMLSNKPATRDLPTNDYKYRPAKLARTGPSPSVAEVLRALQKAQPVNISGLVALLPGLSAQVIRVRIQKAHIQGLVRSDSPPSGVPKVWRLA